MEITLVNSEDAFDELEADWEQLADCSNASYFSSYSYVRTAWRIYKQPIDHLAILVISEQGSPVGIAPFFTTETRIRGIVCRSLNFIGLWQGDRPEIIAIGDKSRIWRESFNYLCNRYPSWNEINLIEQPVLGPGEKGWDFLRRSGLYWKQSLDYVDYYISLEGSFDDYLKRLSSNTRGDWRRKSRRFKEQVGSIEVESVSEPRQLAAALDRFFALERLGWKIDAGVAAGQTRSDVEFLSEIVHGLGDTGAVKIYFLKSGDTDAACIVNFYHRGIVYMKHIVYHPDYGKFSPGIILLGEVIRDLFTTEFKEYDLLGTYMSSPERYKLQWAKEVRETVEWNGYRIAGRLLPWVIMNRLKSDLSGVVKKIRHSEK